MGVSRTAEPVSPPASTTPFIPPLPVPPTAIQQNPSRAQNFPQQPYTYTQGVSGLYPQFASVGGPLLAVDRPAVQYAKVSHLPIAGNSQYRGFDNPPSANPPRGMSDSPPLTMLPAIRPVASGSQHAKVRSR